MEKLLLIDDDKDVLEVLKEILQERFQVTATSTYSVASRLIKDDFDVVLIDYHLKNASGLELALESQKRRSRTYVITTLPNAVKTKELKVLDKLFFEFHREEF